MDKQQQINKNKRKEYKLRYHRKKALIVKSREDDLRKLDPVILLMKVRYYTKTF